MTTASAPATINAPGVWHKSNPPFTRAQLNDAERSPSWVDEYIAMTGVASDLAFNETGVPGIVAKINALLNVDIVETNKTMVALVGQVFDMLSVLRPEWYDLTTGELVDTLPENIDARSKNAIKVEEDAKLAADRKQKAAEAAAKRRADERAAIAGGVTSAKAALGATLAPIITALSGVPFESAHKVLTEELAAAFSNMGITDPYAFQVVYAGLPELWFKELADGTLKLRDSLPKQKPAGLSRYQRSILKAVYAYSEKHGVAETVTTLLLAWPTASFAGAEMVAKESLLPEIIMVEGDEPETLTVESSNG